MSEEGMSEEDFPAAHSMDTEWFAVDSQGHVARFATGEAGAAPESALNSAEETQLSVAEILRSLPTESRIEYYVDDLVSMSGGPVFDYRWNEERYENASFTDASSCYYVLVHLKDESLFAIALSQPPGLLARLTEIAGAER